jgi:DNA-binding response OmpR family regulator
MKKLLIVDDEVGIVDEITEYFTEEGFEVHTADTGKDGIDYLGHLKPDLMLLDMKLPDMSGIEVLRFCKKVSPDTKIIVATGYVDQKVIDEAEILGRDAFMQKPFNLEHLRLEIDRLLN